MDHGADERAPGFHGDEAVVADFDGDDLRAGSDAVTIRVLGEIPRRDPRHLGIRRNREDFFILRKFISPSGWIYRSVFATVMGSPGNSLIFVAIGDQIFNPEKTGRVPQSLS